MTTLPALPDCSVLILSGGRGMRMQGRDKGLVHWHGSTLVEWVHRQVRCLTRELIISCNRNAAAYRPLADVLVTDAEGDYQGPLAGIYRGLQAMTTEWLMVVPCDMPRIDRAMLTALYRCALRSGGRPVMAMQGEHEQPLLCVLPRRALVAVEDAWHAGQRSPVRLWCSLQAVTLRFAADDPRLFNCNCSALLESGSAEPLRSMAEL